MNNELTPGDIEKMQAEIDHRKLVLRPQLLEDVKEARAHGDLSENFEYHAAKRAKNINDSRIRFLERMIKTAHVIDDQTADDEVGINKDVSVYFPEDDEEEIYTIVSTIREDSLNNLISVESPLGKALMHHHVGETVTVVVNRDYSYQCEIRAIADSATAEDAQLRDF